MKKKYTASPLPFQGQKRNFLNHFKEVIKTYPKDATYVDLFGGSGLLSHTVKSEYPEANVIYNDYDNFTQRIKAIPKTNALLEKIRKLVENEPRAAKLSKELQQRITGLIEIEEKKGFIDYVSLSTSILFSMAYAVSFEQLKSRPYFYNNVRKSNFDATGYLEGVEVQSMDYKSLFNQYKNQSNVIFLVDPPYLSTDTGTYKNYWKLTDYLEVLEVLMKTNYVYFTSNKSSIVELCEWIGTKTNVANPFHNATKIEMKASANYNSTYTDIMLYSYINSTL